MKNKDYKLDTVSISSELVFSTGKYNAVWLGKTGGTLVRKLLWLSYTCMAKIETTRVNLNRYMYR